MLPKENRLNRDKDFKNVFEKGRSFYTKIIGIKIIPNSLDNSRFGIIVGKKISKKAVTRNRIKRQIRACLQKELQNIKNGFDFMLIARQGVMEVTYQEIESSIKYQLKKLKVYKNEKNI